MILPEIKKVVLPDCNFPTAWQTVIFRNYGLISLDKIAKVSCSHEFALVIATLLLQARLKK